MVDVFMILGGLALLFFGGEGLIRGAVSLAERFGLSKLLVSSVVIGFGTSMPEMTVSVGAALKGSSDIAISNVVGSNIANILLIVGVAAVIAPIAVAASAARRDTIMMIVASLVLCGLALFAGGINFISGLAMFCGLLAYIFWSYKRDRKNHKKMAQHAKEDIEGEGNLSLARASVFCLGGLVLLVSGAYLMVEGAISLARDFGIPEAVIGLTVVAVGTSLPELATSVVASMRKHGDVIIGNIIGSNLFNIFAILGVTAMVSPVSISGQIARLDVWIMLGVALLLSVYLLRGVKIGRYSGVAMLAAYCGYTFWLYAGTAS